MRGERYQPRVASPAVSSHRDRRIMLGIAVLAVVVALTQSLAPLSGLETGLLYLAPALILALPLLAGRYVAEDQVLRLAAGVRWLRRRRAANRIVARLPYAPRVLVVRGGRLLAAALAERAPPRRSAAR
jgi:hypothetical protein